LIHVVYLPGGPDALCEAAAGTNPRLYNAEVPFRKSVGLSRESLGQHSNDAAVPASDLIHAALEKVLSSQTLVPSPQLCRFLQFIVEQEIAGEGAGLKEYVLGTQVLRKDESFDPASTLRSERRRVA
jgi:hypothetical protein